MASGLPMPHRSLLGYIVLLQPCSCLGGPFPKNFCTLPRTQSEQRM
eukprot:COSAG06_NODE_5157_length_3656_cov_14.975944_3_plen_45_part_01